MFDYILTGPISGVSAGLYLVGLLNELLHYAHLNFDLPVNFAAAVFAAMVTIYFWWENIKGIPESSEKALRIMYVTTVMVVLMLVWCGYTLWARGLIFRRCRGSRILSTPTMPWAFEATLQSCAP